MLNEGVSSHTGTRASLTSGFFVPADTKCIKMSRFLTARCATNHGCNIVVRVVSPVEEHPDKTGKMLVFLLGMIYLSWSQSGFKTFLIMSPWRHMSTVSSSSASSYLMILTEVRFWRSHVTLKTGSDKMDLIMLYYMAWRKSHHLREMMLSEVYGQWLGGYFFFFFSKVKNEIQNPDITEINN